MVEQVKPDILPVERFAGGGGFSKEECRQVWDRTGGSRNRMRAMCHETGEQVAEMIPEGERKHLIDPCRYETYCLVAKDPDSDEAIQLQISNDNSAFCISRGKIGVLSRRDRKASFEDVRQASPRSMGVVLVTRAFAEAPPKNIEASPYFKPIQTYSLLYEEASVPRGVAPEEVPEAVGRLVERVRDYLDRGGLFSFHARRESGEEQPPHGKRLLTPMGALKLAHAFGQIRS